MSGVGAGFVLFIPHPHHYRGSLEHQFGTRGPMWGRETVCLCMCMCVQACLGLLEPTAWFLGYWGAPQVSPSLQRTIWGSPGSVLGLYGVTHFLQEPCKGGKFLLLFSFIDEAAGGCLSFPGGLPLISRAIEFQRQVSSSHWL